MAKGTPNRPIGTITSAEVNKMLSENRAYLGVVVNDPSGDRFLVVSDNNNKVVEAHPFKEAESLKDGITHMPLVVINESTVEYVVGSVASTKLPEKYVITIDPSTTEADLSIKTKYGFGTGTDYQLSPDDKLVAYQAAIYLADDNIRSNSNALQDYLQKSVELIKQGKNLGFESEDFVKQDGRDSFNRSMTNTLIDMQISLGEEKIQQSKQMIDGGCSLNGVLATQSVEETQVKVNYYRAVKDANSNFYEKLQSDGILDSLSSQTKEAREKIFDVWKQNRLEASEMVEAQTGIQLNINKEIQELEMTRELWNSVSKEHFDKKQELTAILDGETYDANDVDLRKKEVRELEDKQTKYGQSINEINERIDQLRADYSETEQAFNNQRKYLETLTELYSNHPSHFNVRDYIENDNKSFSLPPNQNIYQNTADVTGVHNTGTYNGMDMREALEYLKDRNNVISELVRNHETYINIYNKSSGTTNSEKLLDVENYIRNEVLSKSNYSLTGDHESINRFFKSAEFESILHDPRVANYSSLVNDIEGKQTLREMYGIKYKDKNLSNPKEVYDLFNEIKIARQADLKITGQINPDLEMAHKLVGDYIKYNEALISSEYRHLHARGIDNVDVDYNVRMGNYSDKTIEQLSDTEVKNKINFLAKSGIDIDFQSKPSLQQMYQNLHGLTLGRDEKMYEIVTETCDKLSSCKKLSKNGENVSYANLEFFLLDIKNIPKDSKNYEHERAEQILQTFQFECKGKMNAHTVKTINALLPESDLDNYLIIARKYSDVQLFNLSESIRDDLKLQDTSAIVSGHSLTERNPNNTFKIDNNDVRQINDYEVAKILDFKNAYNLKFEAAYDVMESVLDAHKIRNELIDYMQKQMDDPDKRQNLFNALMAIKDTVLTEQGSIKDFNSEQLAIRELADKERTEKIMEVLNVKSEFKSNFEDKKEVLTTIIRGTEFDDEIRKMCNTDPAKIDSYKFEMQKEQNVTQYRNICEIVNVINNMGTRKEFQIDYENLFERGYLEYLNARVDEKIAQCSSDIQKDNYMQLSEQINAIVQHSHTATIEPTLRNLEMAYNLASLNNEQKQTLENEARMIIYNEAIKDGINSTVVVNKAEERIADFQKGNNLSDYAVQQLNEIDKRITRQMDMLISLDDQTVNKQQYSGFVIKEETKISDTFNSQRMATIVSCIKNDKSLDAFIERTQEAIQNNPNYGEYHKINNMSVKMAELEDIRIKISQYQELANEAQRIEKYYSERAHGNRNMLALADQMHNEYEKNQKIINAYKERCNELETPVTTTTLRNGKQINLGEADVSLKNARDKYIEITSAIQEETGDKRQLHSEKNKACNDFLDIAIQNSTGKDLSEKIVSDSEKISLLMQTKVPLAVREEFAMAKLDWVNSKLFEYSQDIKDLALELKSKIPDDGKGTTQGKDCVAKLEAIAENTNLSNVTENVRKLIECEKFVAGIDPDNVKRNAEELCQKISVFKQDFIEEAMREQRSIAEFKNNITAYTTAIDMKREFEGLSNEKLMKIVDDYEKSRDFKSIDAKVVNEAIDKVIKKYEEKQDTQMVGLLNEYKTAYNNVHSDEIKTINDYLGKKGPIYSDANLGIDSGVASAIAKIENFDYAAAKLDNSGKKVLGDIARESCTVAGVKENNFAAVLNEQLLSPIRSNVEKWNVDFIHCGNSVHAYERIVASKDNTLIQDIQAKTDGLVGDQTNPNANLAARENSNEVKVCLLHMCHNPDRYDREKEGNVNPNGLLPNVKSTLENAFKDDRAFYDEFKTKIQASGLKDSFKQMFDDVENGVQHKNDVVNEA